MDMVYHNTAPLSSMKAEELYSGYAASKLHLRTARLQCSQVNTNNSSTVNFSIEALSSRLRTRNSSDALLTHPHRTHGARRDELTKFST